MVELDQEFIEKLGYLIGKHGGALTIETIGRILQVENYGLARVSFETGLKKAEEETADGPRDRKL